MSADWGIDTNLDVIAAQVRSHPPLTLERLAALLDASRSEPHGSAFNALVEHHLDHALSAAIARRDRGVDVADLFQEGSLAVVVAVEEFTAHTGGPAQLGAYVDGVVALHLDAAIERQAADVAAEQLLVTDVELLQAARVVLRRTLGRGPTDLEVGGMLQWSPDRAHSVGAVLDLSESHHDADILRYLDDVDDDSHDQSVTGRADGSGSAGRAAEQSQRH